MVMKPIPFNADTDAAPMPFSMQHVNAASRLKELGLPWTPHVGCFVYDPAGVIEAESPFPGRIYFILSLPRFVKIFGSVEAIGDRLVWLPTWHQARLLGRRLGVGGDEIAALWTYKHSLEPGDELLALYDILADALLGKRDPNVA
jgi:hypothetical protein